MKRMRGNKTCQNNVRITLRFAAGLVGGGVLASTTPIAQATVRDLPAPLLHLSVELDQLPRPKASADLADATPPTEPPLLLAQADTLPLPGARLPPPLPRTFPPGPTPTTPAGPETPVPFEHIEAPPVRRDPQPARIAQELPDLSGESWHLAPIRWGGTSTSMLNTFKDSSGLSTRNITEMLNLRTASHIYQPWFAQVSGNLGLLTGTTRRKLPDNIAVASNDVRTTSLNYGGALNLFPLSRFPLQAYLDHGDSRASGGTLGTQYTSTRLGMRQSYRPLLGSESYAFSYDRSAVSADSRRSVVDALQGNYSLSLADHSISANTRFSHNTGGINGEASRLFSAAGSHLWRVEEGLSVATTANVSDQQIRYLSSGLLASNDNRLMQANSTFTWVPDEDLPLTIIGGGNLLSMQTTTDTGRTQLSNLGAFAGLTYRFSSRFTGTGNFQILQSNSGSAKYLLASGNGSLSYSGVPLTFGNFTYNWNTGTNVIFQSITGGAANQGVAGQLGHALNRAVTFSPANVLTLNLSQNLALSTNSQTGASNTLSHSGGISWRLGYGERITSAFSAMLSDNLATGQYAGHYRTFSLNGNGLVQLSRRASITSNANLSWSQQRQQARRPDDQLVPNTALPQLGSRVFDNNQSQWTGSASIAYNHLNPFSVTNLSYNASVIYSSSQVNQRIINGDPNAMSWQVSRALQQRLLYRIGRINVQALGTVATVNGKKNASIFFQVSRDFGDF